MKKMTRRQFTGLGMAAGAALMFPAPALYANGANEKIRIGGFGCGWRGGQILSAFKNLKKEASVVALADPDPARLNELVTAAGAGAKGFADFRNILDDPNIDAVFVTTCNHWHALAAIWAMQAGKHVYVEKPLSHSIWEGRQIVNAARKYKKICQIGTQQRSDPMQAEIKKFLYDEKALGKILSVRVNRYDPRAAIGKRTEPLPLPQGLDYDLWCGPAEKKSIFRDKLHYDWHWDWNTGNGEMGNWGVHVLDDVLNIVIKDQFILPKKIIAGGARLGMNDAGQTPNVAFVCFVNEVVPIVLGLSNMAEKIGSKKAGDHPGPGSGYYIQCEGGTLAGVRGRATAADKNGKTIKSFKGDSGNGHQKNFLDAIRASDSSILNAEVAIGQQSTSWCTAANIAIRTGKTYNPDRKKESIAQLGQAAPIWETLIQNTEDLLKGREIPLTELKMSSVLELDREKECFTGKDAQQANAYIKRNCRAPYVIPEIDL